MNFFCLNDNWISILIMNDVSLSKSHAIIRSFREIQACFMKKMLHLGYFFVIISSVRLFFARFSGVSFGAQGFVSP